MGYSLNASGPQQRAWLNYLPAVPGTASYRPGVRRSAVVTDDLLVTGNRVVHAAELTFQGANLTLAVPAVPQAVDFLADVGCLALCRAEVGLSLTACVIVLAALVTVPATRSAVGRAGGGREGSRGSSHRADDDGRGGETENDVLNTHKDSS
jgi:hypothetical protein